MRSPIRSLLTLKKTFARFRRNKRGATAVEFALIAPMFFALIFAIIETATIFFAGQVLETGAQDSARLIFTHSAQDSGMTAQAFHDDLCGRIKVMFSCSGLDVDVRFYPQNTTISFTDPIDASGNYVGGNFVYQTPPANSKSTVVVRAFYQWPLFVTGLGYNIANIGKGTTTSKRLLAVTTAFHVEPQ